MFKPGDVVRARFVGAVATKMRPCVVVSTDFYQANRSDLIVSLLTTQLHEATGPTDFVLQDWRTAGLFHPSAFRLFFSMAPKHNTRPIGQLSDRDWQEAQARLRLALAVS